MNTPSKTCAMGKQVPSISASCFDLLCSALFDSTEKASAAGWNSQPLALLSNSEALSELQSLASMNHVIMRAYPRLCASLADEAQTDATRTLALSMKQEIARIRYALPFLHDICEALESAGNVIVIKSLDHWPDLGSDLDLYTDAAPGAIVDIMRKTFQAQVEKQSWGDRLANKWNFALPELPELVEVHIGRLGQTGEQRAIGESLVKRSVYRELDGYRFRVPATEERIVISALQRMFRHFYIRLCDVFEIAQSMDTGVDYDYLHRLTHSSGLWNGVATYLRIISEYVQVRRGSGPPLPDLVRTAAQFGSEKVEYRKGFLRIPIMPHSAKLYISELGSLVSGGEISDSLRLSLLPALATAAAIKQSITNSDKGIW